MSQNKEEKKQEDKYSAKLHTKIALWVLLIGWFPFMWLNLFGMYASESVRFGIVMITFAVCGGAGMSMIGLIGNPAFWSTFEEIQELRADYRTFKAKYQKALQEFVNNQKVEIDE